jgi:hypothetical protein
MSVSSNRLSKRFALDTDLVGRESEAMSRLWELDADGWIQLVKTDALDTELSGTSDPIKRERLRDETAGMLEQMGPVVLGHSRLDHTVLGSDEDAVHLDAVIETLLAPARREDGCSSSSGGDCLRGREVLLPRRVG